RRPRDNFNRSPQFRRPLACRQSCVRYIEQASIIVTELSLTARQPMHRNLFVLLLAFALLPTGVIAADPLVIDLWPAGKVPDEPGTIGAEYVRMSPGGERKQTEATEPTRLITNVTSPTITIHRPPKDKETGTAMIISP